MENVDNEGGADIAQMIVLGGFLVAIGIVAVTLSLNLIIFSQDLSTRDTGEYERSVHETNTVMDRGALEALESANRQYLSDTTDPGDIDEDEINAFLGDFEEAMGNLTEHRGRLSSMDTDETEVTETNWRIVQNESGTIQAESGERTWNLTETYGSDPITGDVDDINRFRFDIDSGEDFQVSVIEEEGDGWLFLDDVTGWIMNVNETHIYTCAGDDFDPDFAGFDCADGTDRSGSWSGDGTIDVVEGTVNGETEENGEDWSYILQNNEFEARSDMFISFDNDDDVEGTYDIMFDDDGNPTDVTAGDAPGSHDGRLFVTGAVYEAEFEMEYRDDSVSHTRGMEVTAP